MCVRGFDNVPANPDAFTSGERPHAGTDIVLEHRHLRSHGVDNVRTATPMLSLIVKTANEVDNVRVSTATRKIAYSHCSPSTPRMYSSRHLIAPSPTSLVMVTAHMDSDNVPATRTLSLLVKDLTRN